MVLKRKRLLSNLNPPMLCDDLKIVLESISLVESKAFINCL